MLRTAITTLVVDAVRKRAGVDAAGPVTSTLIGTGAAMLLRPGRRALGLILVSAGGYLLWRAKEAEAGAKLPPPALPQYRPATASAG